MKNLSLYSRLLTINLSTVFLLIINLIGLEAEGRGFPEHDTFHNKQNLVNNYSWSILKSFLQFIVMVNETKYKLIHHDMSFINR